MRGVFQEVLAAALAAEPDLRVVGVSDPDPDQVAGAVALRDVHVVVLSLPSDSTLGEYDPLLYRHPHLRVVAVIGGGTDATLYELRPARERLGPLTLDAFLATVRAVPADR